VRKCSLDVESGSAQHPALQPLTIMVTTVTADMLRTAEQKGGKHLGLCRTVEFPEAVLSLYFLLGKIVSVL
jgi:hypothetical protein